MAFKGPYNLHCLLTKCMCMMETLHMAFKRSHSHDKRFMDPTHEEDTPQDNEATAYG